MILFKYEAILYNKKYEGTIESENMLRAREILLRKYDKIEQLYILNKL